MLKSINMLVFLLILKIYYFQVKEIWKDRLCAISCGKASQRINNAGKCFLLYHMKELFCVFGLVAQTVVSSTGWEMRAAEVGG